MSEKIEQDIKDYCDHIEKIRGGGPMLGATLRDYFAIKAMQSIEVVSGGGTDEWLSKEAYERADAMLAERAK